MTIEFSVRLNVKDTLRARTAEAIQDELESRMRRAEDQAVLNAPVGETGELAASISTVGPYQYGDDRWYMSLKADAAHAEYQERGVGPHQKVGDPLMRFLPTNGYVGKTKGKGAFAGQNVVIIGVVNHPGNKPLNFLLRALQSEFKRQVFEE